MTLVAARRRPFGLLGQRNFRLLWTGETVSATGNAMATVGVPLLAVAVLHASTFAVAALTAAAYLPWLVIGLPAGAWVDRLPPRPAHGHLRRDLRAAVRRLPVAAWTGTLSTSLVVAVALLAGTVNVFFATAYQVYLPSLVTRDELVEGNAKLQAGLSVASITGRGAVGLAQAVGPPPPCCSTRAVSSCRPHACCASTRRTAPPPLHPHRSPHRSPRPSPRSGPPCGPRSPRASGGWRAIRISAR